jgi:hypothetical protein
MKVCNSDFPRRLKVLSSGREVLALLRPLLARSRTEWNHEDVLALARRLHCCGSVDGTGDAENLEGEISNILLSLQLLFRV